MRDFSQVRGDGVIDVETAQSALNMLKIDELGLDAVDRKMLVAMIEIFKGGPVGLDGLLTCKYKLHGHGDTVGGFGEGKRSFVEV